jgi:SanA protein
VKRRLVLVVPAVVIALVAIGNCAIEHRAAGLSFDDAAQVPARTWAIVPGAMVHDDGTLSAALEDRVDAARALYAAGTVQRIFVSGDGGGNDEDGTMARWLEAHGVPASAIVRDSVGFRTRTTMEDAAALGIRDAIVCTQGFHLPRSLAWARHEGIDAVGFVADNRWHDHQVRAKLREAVARTVAWIELW